MAETLPMLENDPRRAFRMSRILRVAVFSFIVSTVLVLVLITLVRFLWDAWLRHLAPKMPFVGGYFDGGEYSAHPLLVVPMIVFVSAVMGWGIWGNAEGLTRPTPPKQGRPKRT